MHKHDINSELVDAVSSGNLDTLKLLLARPGADVNFIREVDV